MIVSQVYGFENELRVVSMGRREVHKSNVFIVAQELEAKNCRKNGKHNLALTAKKWEKPQSLSLFPFLCSVLDAYNCSERPLARSKFVSLKKSFLTLRMHIISESQIWTLKPSESCRQEQSKKATLSSFFRTDILS